MSSVYASVDKKRKKLLIIFENIYSSSLTRARARGPGATDADPHFEVGSSVKIGTKIAIK